MLAVVSLFLDPEHEGVCEIHSMWLTGLSPYSVKLYAQLLNLILSSVNLCEYKLKATVKQVQVYIRIGFLIVRDMKGGVDSTMRLKDPCVGSMTP